MKYLWGILFAFVFVGFSFSQVYAAQPLEASITSVTNNGVLTMEPGERTTVTVQFKNTGAQTWSNDGAGYISLYTHGPKYRKSVFDPGTWLWGDHLQRIREITVLSGGVGTVVFDLRAPAAEGYYEEVFALASESIAWIPGGELKLKITVKDDSETEEVAQESGDATGLSTMVAAQSANRVKAIGGKPIAFTVAFKNTGTATWNSYGLYAPDVTIASDISDFTHPSWNGNELAYISNAPVKPGENAIVSFAFNAPNTDGSHTANFVLKANGVEVPGGDINIPVEVTGGSGQVISAPENENETESEEANYIEEPILRVGVLIVDEETDWEVVITSLESDFDLRDINGNLLAELPVNSQVTAYYDEGYYFYDVGRGLEKSTYGLRFIPKTVNAVMRVANWDRRLTRNAAYADNEFRNILELRYAEYKDRVWLINELPIELYLRGIAETSNVSPMEFQKTLLTAARTFAFYHWTHNTKRVKEYMHVVSWSDDQVYNGYGQEKRAPKITEAVEATRGSIVTYEGELAITPYFSRSDGRTRDWSEVWNGDVPWAKSVPVPCDEGMTMWGHGIGLSAHGALCMANDGMKWDEILKYFYTGIDITKKWK